MHNIQFGNATIPYEVIFSNRRKTVSIAVDKNVLLVTVPSNLQTFKTSNTPYDKIADIVYKKLHRFPPFR